MRQTKVTTLFDANGKTAAVIRMFGDGTVKISPRNGCSTFTEHLEANLDNSAVAYFFDDVVIGNNLKRVTAKGLWHAYILYCMNHSFIAEPLVKFSADLAKVSEGKYYHTKANITQAMIDSIYAQDEYLKTIKENMGRVGYRVAAFFRRDEFAEYRADDAIAAGILTDDDENVLNYFDHIFKLEFRVERIPTSALYEGYKYWCKSQHETQASRNAFYHVLNDELPKRGYTRHSNRMRQSDIDNIVKLHQSHVKCFDVIDENISRKFNPISLVMLK